MSDEICIGGVHVGSEIAPGIFAEKHASGRWIIRMLSMPDFAQRVGEVMGGSGSYQAQLMRGDFVSNHNTLLDASTALVEREQQGKKG